MTVLPPPIVLEHTTTPLSFDAGEITFIGTATVLVRYAGFTVLTDPNFLHKGDRAYVGLGVSTRRLTEPAMSIGELPPLDFIILSHHHGDHFDDIAARELDKDLPIVTEGHAAKKLRLQGFRRPIPLGTWQAQTFERGDAWARVTSVPGKHAPELLGRLIPPVMGSVVEFGHGNETSLRLYITGDPLLYDGLNDIARRYPEIDLCIIHLGGTKIAGILLTMDAAQGVKALQIIAPRAAIPVHYNDYTLFRSPLEDFRAAAAAAELACELHYLGHGQTHRLVVGP